MAGVIVAHFAIAPAIAAGGAALIVKLFFRNTKSHVRGLERETTKES